jgi:MFS family permease
MSEFSIDATSIGILSSLYFFTYAAMQIPTGFLIDRYGPRRILTFFCLIATIGTLLFAISPNFLIIMIGRTFIGIGVSVAFLSTVRLVASWFERRSFASLTGVLTSTGTIGGMFATTPLALMVIYYGWRSSFALISVLTLILAILIWFIIRDAPKKAALSINKSLNLAHIDKIRKNSFSGIRLAFRNRDFLLITFPTLFFFGSFFGFQGLWGVPYVMQFHGIEKVEASAIIMMISIGFCIGGPIWGLISDRVVFSRKIAYLYGAILYSCTWGLLILPINFFPNLFLSFIFFLMGFFFGVMPSSIAMVKELFPLRNMGTTTGIANAFPFIGAALFQIFLGLFLDKFGLVDVVEGVRIYSNISYQLGLILCFISVVFGTIMIPFIRHGNKINNS